jgi:hypothetical protein
VKEEDSKLLPHTTLLFWSKQLVRVIFGAGAHWCVCTVKLEVLKAVLGGVRRFTGSGG